MSTPMTTPNPGERIREQRRAAGLSRERLAIAADCSLTMLSLIERGYTPNGGAVLPRIERVLAALTPNEQRSGAQNPTAAKADDAGPPSA